MTSVVPESRGQWMPQLRGQRQELSRCREPRGAWRRKLFGAGGGPEFGFLKLPLTFLQDLSDDTGRILKPPTSPPKRLCLF